MANTYNYNGEMLRPSAISQRLGLSAQTLPRIIRTYEFTEENVYEFLQYITDRVAPASTNVNLNTIGVLNTQGAEIHHIFDSLYEFTCPECGRKLLLTSDEICVGKEII